MTGLTRWQLVAAFFALMFLRMVIGYHFFHEGAQKLQTGKFDSAPFLKQATGPLAPYFHNMLDDYDGHWRLCVVDRDEYGQPIEPEINTTVTFAIWDDFDRQISERYRFQDGFLLNTLREQLAGSDDPKRQSILKEKIAAVENQLGDASRIVTQHKQLLTEFLANHRDGILAYAKSANRLTGFQRDGDQRQSVADNVASLKEQIDQIAWNRRSNTADWFDAIESIWDSLEDRLNALAIDEQLTAKPVELHRPYELEWSMPKFINEIIPWFDTIVGGLLILGLLTRFAALAGILFLLSVALSQPFWVAGSMDTWLQWFEISGLCVIFATCAGRYGGLDYFISQFVRKRSVPHADLDRVHYTLE